MPLPHLNLADTYANKRLGPYPDVSRLLAWRSSVVVRNPVSTLGTRQLASSLRYVGVLARLGAFFLEDALHPTCLDNPNNCTMSNVCHTRSSEG